MLDKSFDPKTTENKLYTMWESTGQFKPNEAGKDAYCIMMPPPNVTGSLHIGHALTFTLQDILIRYHRSLGKNVLWQPGTDHAGIATQMLVERQLGEQGITKHDLGREAFLEKVWEWKDKSGNMILDNLKRLGASADWSRSRFTLDEGLSERVKDVFVTLYEQGLIYRDQQLVNWDPHLQTAISDLEVEQRDMSGHLWHLAYPLADNPEVKIVVATTRPETMLGDTAVAVHPEDERYQELIGKQVKLPLSGRLIPIVADEHADPTKGSGAVKITPAHDFNDFAVGQRHDLPMINVLNSDATLNENAPDQYQGLSREEARKKIVAEMDALGLLVKIEDTQHAVPYGDRSGVVIEPWLTDQWYVNAEKLAEPAIKAVEDGKVKFVPENWSKTYFQWMRNIQPWCISRQLWWGHRIPAWYGPDGEIFVARDAEAAQAKATAHYGEAVELKQDDDVLDTWFSSGLWPFSTLDWPDNEAFKTYYPTQVLVTGFDIIFFWVARMIMMGMHFTGEIPFETVYVHALVRDEHGQKMSKSKGNVIDPNVLIDAYGCDAVRYALAGLSVPGQDIKLAESQVEIARNFGTKLWNAARYAEMQQATPVEVNAVKPTLAINHWILAQLSKTKADIAMAVKEYRFDVFASTAQHFIRDDFCDWYIELTKPIFWDESEAAAAKQTETRAVMAYVLDEILQLLHPLMPYITEAIWQDRHNGATQLIAAPQQDLPIFDDALANETKVLIGLIAAIRSTRSDINMPAGETIPIHIKALQDNMRRIIENNQALVERLARVAEIAFIDQAPSGFVQALTPAAEIYIPLEGYIDVAAEQARLQKDIDKVAAEIAKLDKRLNDESFKAKAPDHIIQKAEDERAVLMDKSDRIAAQLQRFTELAA